MLLPGTVGFLGACRDGDPGGEAAGRQRKRCARRHKDASAPAPPQSPAARHSTIGRDPPPPRTVAELVEEARRVTERLAKAFPDHPDAIELKARLHYYLGKCCAASECWERCLKLDPEYAYAYHGLGLVAAKKADYERAVVLQRQALRRSPGYSQAARELADALMKSGRIDRAVEVLEHHVKANPDSTLTYVSLGQACLAAKQFQQAKEAFQTALEAHPDMPRAQFGLVTALARLGQKEEWKQAVAKHEQLRAKEIKVNTDRRSRFNDLAAISARFAVNYTHAARVYLAHRKLAQAERLGRRAATLDPTNTDCRILLASFYQQTGRQQEALRICRQLTEIAPKNPWFHLNLGVLCGNMQRFDAAEEAFKQVTRLAPQSSQGHVALARLYLRSGRKLAEAARLAKQAVKLTATAPNYSLLSQARAANGDRAGAISAIEKAIGLDPDNGRYQRALKLLREGD